jgi:5-methylcytosine-specific restriction endonuclease McrA
VRASAWYKANKDKKRAYDAKRREEKRHLYRAASKKHRETHPDRKRADTNARRRRVREATPSWANRFFIKEIYLLAQKRNELTNIEWAVDHIIPIRGKTVSGLHVESNLQVIPEAENRKKGNHFSINYRGQS